MLNDAVILVTGGSGSFGHKFVKMTLEKYNPKKVIIFCRDEMKQWEMSQEYTGDKRVRFFLGDVRDKDRLKRACEGVDYIVHAAAGKIVPTAEYNPFEYIKTNVFGAMNVVDCAIDCGVKRVVALSTDKACNPVNLYGATKLCSDKVFVAGNSYAGEKKTRFCVVRYGNVMGSRGSILPYFMDLARKGAEIPVTHKDMTRFLISLDKAVDLVWLALQDSKGGETYVRKCPSMKIGDLATTIAPNSKINYVGIRPGEKMHEQMISVEDARHTVEFDTYYKIQPVIYEWGNFEDTADGGKPCAEGFSYSSDSNDSWMDPEELRGFLKREFGFGV